MESGKNICKELFEALVTESLIVFQEILEQHQEVYVLGLYHMGGFDGVLPMFNTLSHVPTKPNADISEMQMNEYCDAMWAPTSFPMLEMYSDRLPDSEDELAKMADTNHVSQWDFALNTMIMAMKTVALNPLFAQMENPPAFYVATYDESWSDRTPRIKLINSTKVAEKILPDFIFMEELQARWETEACREEVGDS